MNLHESWSAFTAVAAEQHGAAHRRQGAEVGLDAKRITAGKRSGRITEPVPGVLLLAGTAPIFRQRLMVATLAGNGTVASHRSAALLHGFDGVDVAPVEVTVKRGRFPAIPNVKVHRATPLPERDITVVDGIRASSVARTLCDLGAVLPQDDVERCLDGVLRRGVSERWIRDTLARVHRPGPSGTPTLARILADPRRTGGVPDSWMERLLRRAVHADDLPPIVLQHEVTSGRRVVARFDLALPEWKIGLEAHSAEFHDRPGRVWRDLERDNEVKALGWAVIYITWALAKRPDAVLDLIRRTRTGRLAS